MVCEIEKSFPFLLLKYSDSITRFALSATPFPVRQIVSISFAHEAKKLLLTLLQTVLKGEEK